MTKRLQPMLRPVARGSSIAVATVLVLTLGACGGAPHGAIPAAPANVTANAVAGGVRVSWTPIGDDATGFVIYRHTVTPSAGDSSIDVATPMTSPRMRNAAGAVEDEDGFTKIAEAPKEATHYDDLTAETDRAYLYRVAASGPGGMSGVTQQSEGPVTPLPAVALTLTFEGDGTIRVDDGTTVRSCVADCTLPYAAGTQLELEAVGNGGQVFAGWTGACDGAGPCTVTVDGPTNVGATFATTVLTVSLRGDASVTATISPGTGGFDEDTCVLEPGQACAVTYPQGNLSVSVNLDMTTAEGGATTEPFQGCDVQQNGTYCLVSVASGASQVTATVLHVPVATADGFELLEDQALTVDAAGVLDNDHDSPGDPLTAVLDTVPAHGTLVLDEDGGFRYRPHADYNGQDGFSYHAQDAYGNASPSVTATLDVTALNDAPAFDLDADPPRIQDGQGAQSVAGFATGIGPGGGPDEAGQSLSFVLSTVVAPGDSLTFDDAPAIATDGTLSYTPTTGTYGSATVTATLIDDGGTADGGEDSSARTFPIAVRPLVLTTTTSGPGEIEAAPPPERGGYPYGAQVRLTATPHPGARFAGWGGACATPGNATGCNLRLTSDTVVSADFVEVHTLKVTMDGVGDTVGGGSVTSDPEGLNCPYTCEAGFDHGTQVTLTATEAWYSDFTGWSGDCSGTGTCTLSMNEAHSVTAVFVYDFDDDEDDGAPAAPSSRSEAGVSGRRATD